MAEDAHRVLGGRYALQRCLGSGGMAEVWLAADRRLNDKPVAVKRLHGFRTGGAATEDVERARREAFAASQLSHPNLVAVTDFLVDESEPVIVMEYVAGSTLEDLAVAGGLTGEHITRIGAQVAAGLDEAHTAGIVHRDVKPANVILTPRGDAKLADFGIARAAEDPRMTKTGMFTGTVRYLAPELLNGAPASPTSDMWSLGATLFELSESRPAFAGETTMAIVAAIAMVDPPRVARHPELAPIVAAMLDRDPRRRPTAAAVAAELEPRRYARSQTPPPFVAGSPYFDANDLTRATDRKPLRVDRHADTVIAAGRTGPPPPVAHPRTRPKRRARAYLLVAVPAVIALAAGAVVIATRGPQRNPVASEPRPGNYTSSTPANLPSEPPSRSLSSVASTSAPPPVVTGEGPTSFGGVTVFGATDLTRAPEVRSRATKAPRAVRIRDLVVGTGTAATPDSTVRVNFVGVLHRTGKPFDSSWDRGTPETFALPAVVPGFRVGIGGSAGMPAMRVGGRRIVIIPARLGYGRTASGPIPPDAAIVFVVDLVAVD